jgi:hypothetical protein
VAVVMLKRAKKRLNVKTTYLIKPVSGLPEVNPDLLTANLSLIPID